MYLEILGSSITWKILHAEGLFLSLMPRHSHIAYCFERSGKLSETTCSGFVCAVWLIRKREERGQKKIQFRWFLLAVILKRVKKELFERNFNDTTPFFRYFSCIYRQ